MKLYANEFIGLYPSGYTQWIHDEMELGERVAMALDSENNAYDIHFIEGDTPESDFEKLTNRLAALEEKVQELENKLEWARLYGFSVTAEDE